VFPATFRQAITHTLGMKVPTFDDILRPACGPMFVQLRGFCAASAAEALGPRCRRILSQGPRGDLPEDAIVFQGVLLHPRQAVELSAAFCRTGGHRLQKPASGAGIASAWRKQKVCPIIHRSWKGVKKNGKAT